MPPAPRWAAPVATLGAPAAPTFQLFGCVVPCVSFLLRKRFIASLRFSNVTALPAPPYPPPHPYPAPAHPPAPDHSAAPAARLRAAIARRPALPPCDPRTQTAA